jgi:hypothetical protein
MPTECSRDLFGFAPVAGREVVAAFDGGAITSDAEPLWMVVRIRAKMAQRKKCNCSPGWVRGRAWRAWDREAFSERQTLQC